MFLMSRWYTSIFDGLVLALGLILPTLQMGTPYQILFWNCGHYLPTNLINDLVVWELMRALDSVQIAPYKLVQDSPESSLGLLTFKQPAPSSRKAFSCLAMFVLAIKFHQIETQKFQSTSSCPFICVSISRATQLCQWVTQLARFRFLLLRCLWTVTELS